jgi:exosortase/archaeosortase family protein
MYNEFIYNITLILLFIGLLLLLIGYFLQKRSESHFILIIGWVTFGLFWLMQVPHFIALGDFFNAMFCFLGFVLFLYFTFHEILNIMWNESLYSLNYIAGITAVAGIFYYMFERIEPFLIYIVTWKTVGILKLIGFDAGIGGFGCSVDTNEIALAITGTNEGIILACTGIQSIAIFIGVLIVTKSNRKLWVPWTKDFIKKEAPKEIKKSRLRNWFWVRKQARLKKVLNMTDRGRFIRTFVYTIPIIYILNIFRNVSIIYGTELQVLGENTFYIAHNYLSKFLSLVVLIILLFIVFELLPEALEGVMGLMDLPKRTRKGMVKDGFIEFEKKKEPEEEENIPDQAKEHGSEKRGIRDKDHKKKKAKKTIEKD